MTTFTAGIAKQNPTAYDAYYSYVNADMVQYQVPDWGKVSSASLEIDSFGKILSTFELSGSIPISSNEQAMAESSFISEGQYYRVVAPIGTAKFYGSSVVDSGYAAIIDANNNVIDVAMVNVQGSILSVNFQGLSFSSIQKRMTTFRYLPAGATTSAGLNDGHTTTYALDANLEHSRIILDYLPQGIPNSPVPPSISMLYADESDEIPVHDLEFDIIRDLREPLRTPPGATCPPILPTPKPSDINGDGVTDWDYPMDQPLGNGNKLIDLWGIDLGPVGAVANPNGTYSDCFVLVIGTDSNGNGKLDANEITAVIGACTFYSGQNLGWIDKDTNVVHWVNIEYHKDSNGRLTNRIKTKRHYIYNPNTGKLKVWVDDDGDGPLPPRLEWPTDNPSGGDPNDYPWGNLGLGGD